MKGAGDGMVLPRWCKSCYAARLVRCSTSLPVPHLPTAPHTIFTPARGYTAPCGFIRALPGPVLLFHTIHTINTVQVLVGLGPAPARGPDCLG